MKSVFQFSLAAMLLLPATAKSVDFVGIDFCRHEFKFGFGKGVSFEDDPFNTQFEPEIDPDFAWNVEYDFNIDERAYGPTVKLNGFSMGTGAGALVQIWRHLGISVEGNINIGVAQWKEKPFLNSEGQQINPGFMGLILNLAWLW